MPAGSLAATFESVRACARGAAVDPFGRSFADAPELEAPYCAVKVTGALFHTQGGLVVDSSGRVIAEDGGALPNLYAACGVSGNDASGYLSGNGLLTAVTLGLAAGRHAGRAAAMPPGVES